MSEYINIPIELISDEKGYFDRQCPNPECEYIFKINMKDWENNVSDEEVHCPMCGHINASDNWMTKNQIEEVKKIALSWAKSYIQKELNKTLTSANSFVTTSNW
jgi:RNA polymerase subunit RPABC4/transcription elongation factor Spt4